MAKTSRLPLSRLRAKQVAVVTRLLAEAQEELELMRAEQSVVVGKIDLLREAIQGYKAALKLRNPKNKEKRKDKTAQEESQTAPHSQPSEAPQQVGRQPSLRGTVLRLLKEAAGHELDVRQLWEKAALLGCRTTSYPQTEAVHFVLSDLKRKGASIEKTRPGVWRYIGKAA